MGKIEADIALESWLFEFRLVRDSAIFPTYLLPPSLSPKTNFLHQFQFHWAFHWANTMFDTPFP